MGRRHGFPPAPAVTEALEAALARGVFGYFGDDRAYKAAIAGWMARRHGWQVDPDWIGTAHGLVAGCALCLQAFTEPDDGVILFTPVYHAFARIIRANGRRVVESPLRLEDGRYRMDLEALAASLTGQERMLIFCSPHNPGAGSGTGPSSPPSPISAPPTTCSSSPTRCITTWSCPGIAIPPCRSRPPITPTG